jgi:hypothetical protein
MIAWLALITASGQAETSFVNVRSAQWNVVFRLSVADTRIERMAARCGAGWVNVCASRIAPGQRQAALTAGLQPQIQMFGGYGSCKDVRLPRASGAVLQRQTLQPDPTAFCRAMGLAPVGPPVTAARPGGGGPLPDGPASLPSAPAPRAFVPPAAPASQLGNAPGAVVTREAMRSPPPAPPPPPPPTAAPELPSLTAAGSPDEFDLLDMEEVEIIRPERPEDDKKKRKRDEAKLRDRKLSR